MAIALPGSLKNLIGRHKQPVVNAHKRYPEQYGQQVYVNKQMSDAITMVAKAEKCTRKEAAEHILEDGFSKYLTDNILKYNELKDAGQLDLTENARYRKFMRILTQFIKKKDPQLKIPVKEILSP